MYKGFQLVFSTFDVARLKKYYSEGKALYDNQKAQIQASLSQYIDPDGYLDGARIQEEWFPQNDYKFNVFLSHSHKDEQMMIALAGYLNKELHLNCFIDSQLWGYCDDLQLNMDKKCCRYDSVKKTWNYDDRNISTSYVHNMLMVALTQMMDNTECFFFAKTASSTIQSQTNQTLSPWIYSELSIAKLLRPRPNREEKVSLFESGGQLRTYSLQTHVKFTPPMDYLINLTWYDIVDWAGIVRRNFNYKNYPHPLDVLYHLKGIYK